MSEQEEIRLFDKISNGLKQSYETLLKRKAALGQDMVIADASRSTGCRTGRRLTCKKRRKNKRD